MSREAKASAISFSVVLSAAFFFVLGFLLDYSGTSGFDDYGDYGMIFGMIFGPITIISFVVYIILNFVFLNHLQRIEWIKKNHGSKLRTVIILQSIGITFISLSSLSVFDSNASRILFPEITSFLGVLSYAIGLVIFDKTLKQIYQYFQLDKKKQDVNYYKIGGVSVLTILIIDSLVRNILRAVTASIRCSVFSCREILTEAFYSKAAVLNFISFVLFFLVIIFLTIGFFQTAKNFKILSSKEQDKKDAVISMSFEDQVRSTSSKASLSLLTLSVIGSFIFIDQNISHSLYSLSWDFAFYIFLLLILGSFIIAFVTIFQFSKFFFTILLINNQNEKHYKKNISSFLAKISAFLFLFIGLVYDFLSYGRMEIEFVLSKSLMLISCSLFLISLIYDLGKINNKNKNFKNHFKEIVKNPIIIYILSLLTFVVIITISHIVIGVMFSSYSHSNWTILHRDYDAKYRSIINILQLVSVAISLIFTLIAPFVLSYYQNMVIRSSKKKQLQNIEQRHFSEKYNQVLNLVFAIFSYIFAAIYVTSICLLVFPRYTNFDLAFSLMFVGFVFLLTAAILYLSLVHRRSYDLKKYGAIERSRKQYFYLTFYSGIVFFGSILFQSLSYIIEIRIYIVVSILVLISLVIHSVGIWVYLNNLKTIRKIEKSERLIFYATISCFAAYLLSFLIRIISDKYDWNAFDSDAIWIIFLEIAIFLAVSIAFIIGNYKVSTNNITHQKRAN